MELKIIINIHPSSNFRFAVFHMKVRVDGINCCHAHSSVAGFLGWILPFPGLSKVFNQPPSEFP